MTIFVYKPQNKRQLFKICIVSNFIAKKRENLCFLDLLNNRFSYVFPNQTDNLILYCLTRASGICMASFMIFLMAHHRRQCGLPTRQESFPYLIFHRRSCHLCALLGQWTVFHKSGRTLQHFSLFPCFVIWCSSVRFQFALECFFSGLRLVERKFS